MIRSHEMWINFRRKFNQAILFMYCLKQRHFIISGSFPNMGVFRRKRTNFAARNLVIASLTRAWNLILPCKIIVLGHKNEIHTLFHSQQFPRVQHFTCENLAGIFVRRVLGNYVVRVEVKWNESLKIFVVNFFLIKFPLEIYSHLMWSWHLLYFFDWDA